MGIRVRYLQDGYKGDPYNRRIRQGEIIVIRSMKEFSPNYMKKVDIAAESEVDDHKASDGRIARPASDGNKAVHEGGVQHPSQREGDIPPADGIDEETKVEGGEGGEENVTQGPEQEVVPETKDGTEVSGDEVLI